MTANVTRIGRWTTKSALESALEQVHDDDSLIIISICHEDNTLRFWNANTTNMQVNWMVDSVKADLFFGNL